MNLRSWRWARREIAHLDPSRDAQRLAHLSFEVRFGTPIFLHALFNIAFVYNVGIPAIAETLYRDGRGTTMRQTHKRNFDSMIFFGELYRLGDSAEGAAVCARLNRIHAHYNIPNELSLYTLATLACLPYRIGRRYTTSNGPSPAEYDAQCQLWRRLGGILGIHDIPESLPDFVQWMLDYEQHHLAPSAGGRALAEVQAQEWAAYWFPPPLRPTARGVFMTLVEPSVRRAMGLPEPSWWHRLLGQLAVRGFFAIKTLLPDPPERGMATFFSKHYTPGTDLSRVGVDAS